MGKELVIAINEYIKLIANFNEQKLSIQEKIKLIDFELPKSEQDKKKKKEKRIITKDKKTNSLRKSSSTIELHTENEKKKMEDRMFYFQFRKYIEEIQNYDKLSENKEETEEHSDSEASDEDFDKDKLNFLQNKIKKNLKFFSTISQFEPEKIERLSETKFFNAISPFRSAQKKKHKNHKQRTEDIQKFPIKAKSKSERCIFKLSASQPLKLSQGQIKGFLKNQVTPSSKIPNAQASKRQHFTPHTFEIKYGKEDLKGTSLIFKKQNYQQRMLFDGLSYVNLFEMNAGHQQPGLNSTMQKPQPNQTSNYLFEKFSPFQQQQKPRKFTVNKAFSTFRMQEQAQTQYQQSLFAKKQFTRQSSDIIKIAENESQTKENYIKRIPLLNQQNNGNYQHSSKLIKIRNNSTSLVQSQQFHYEY